MNLKNIMLGVIVILILYATYSYFFKDHTSVDLVGLHNAKKKIKNRINKFTWKLW